MFCGWTRGVHCWTWGSETCCQWQIWTLGLWTMPSFPSQTCAERDGAVKCRVQSLGNSRSPNTEFFLGSVVKNSSANAGDKGLTSGSGRSHGGGNGNPLQHSCLENPVATRAWWGTVHEVTNSQTRLSRHSELSTLSELWSEMILPAQCHILLFSFPFFCSFIFLLLLLYPSFPCRQIGQ